MSDIKEEILGLEERLRQTLNSERAPVMGPCLESIRSREPELLEHPILNKLRQILRAGEDPVNSIVSCLLQWPAITVLLITEQVNQVYGDENEYAVHAAVEKLIGAQSALSSSARKKVWSAFRAASYRIGLKINSRESGVGYMIDEFLHQAGLPLSFVERVTHSMIRTASEVGLPDEDDPEGVSRWQECLLRHSKYLPPTARRSLQADETGFYARTFLKAYSSAGEPSTRTAEGIMARVLTEPRYRERSGKWHRALRIPRLLWRNDELVVELPPGDDLEWLITVDGEGHTYRGEIAAEAVPLMATLPRVLSISDGTFSNEYVIWEDEADNRFQIFNADGQWVQASSLGSGTVKLAPGDFSLLLRFEPTDTSERCHCVAFDPDLFVLSVTLLPGQEFTLRRGPATTTLRAESRPWIRFNGDRILAAGGESVFLCKGLYLDLALGESDAESLSRRSYFVRVEAGGREVARVPALDGKAVLEDIGKLDPGLHRIVAELCPEGTERAITRTSVLLWRGLERRNSNGALQCSIWPMNLVTSGCENSSFQKDQGTIGPRDSLSPIFRTEFAVTNGRTIILDWSVPGVFIEVEDHAISPVLHRRFEAGSVLALPPQSRQLLRIRSTEEGHLLLDSRRIKELVSGRTVSLHLSSLAERLDAGCGVLKFQSSNGRICDLADLVAPHQICDFVLRRSPRQCQVAFGFALPCSEVRCHVENFLTGFRFELSATCDDANNWAESSMMRLESGEFVNGVHGYVLTLQTRDLSPGAWLFDFEVCLSGRWGAPTNVRQDGYCFGLLIQRSGDISSSLDAVLECCSEHAVGAQLEWLRRVHSALQRCYAPECWESLAWLKPLWKRWLAQLAPLNREKIQNLVGLCEISPPDSAALSWLPLQRVESTVLEMFAQPLALYADIEKPSTSLGLCLSAISRLGERLARFPAELVNPFVACGFGIQRMIAGEPPSEFDLAKYREGLLSSPTPTSWPSNWRPCNTDFLGRTHYQVSWERLRDRYRGTLSGNDVRRQFSMPLCLKIERERLTESVLLRRVERKFEGESVEEMFLCAMESFLSALARECRRDVRNPGVLDEYRRKLRHMLPDGSCSLNDVMSFVLQLGSDLFGFYLLLWEIILAAEANTQGHTAHA